MWKRGSEATEEAFPALTALGNQPNHRIDHPPSQRAVILPSGHRIAGGWNLVC